VSHLRPKISPLIDDDKDVPIAHQPPIAVLPVPVTVLVRVPVSQCPINIFGGPEKACHRSTGEAKERRGVGFIAFSLLRNRTKSMNWSCKAIWYTDAGYEIYFASERNWISYGPDGWVHLAISLDDAKQMCDSQEKARTDILGRP
jgi:hypothetical protein